MPSSRDPRVATAVKPFVLAVLVAVVLVPEGSARAAEGALDDRSAALAALERYRQAMEARDLEALGRVFPSVADEKAKGRQVAMSFELTRALQLEIEVLDVELDGDQAAVRCKRHDRIELTNGQKFDNLSGALFHLRRGDGGWIIVAIEEAEL